MEDEPDARDLIRHVLQASSAHVVEAATADEAVRVLEQCQPDVIISDIGLPGEDGYALMRRLRSSGVNVPAAALAAFARTEDRTRSHAAGYQVTFQSPLTRRSLSLPSQRWQGSLRARLSLSVTQNDGRFTFPQCTWHDFTGPSSSSGRIKCRTPITITLGKAR